MSDIITVQTQQLQNHIKLFLVQFESKNTRTMYMNSLKKFFSFLYQHGFTGDVREIKKSHVDLYTRFVSLAHASTTVKAKLSCVFSFCKYLCEQEIIDRNPCEFVRLPTVSNEGKTPVISQEQTEDMLHIAKDHAAKDHTSLKFEYSAKQRYIVLMLLSLTGIRISELLNIKYKDIEVASSDAVRINLIAKGNKAHHVYAPIEVQTLIQEFRQTYRSHADNEQFVFVAFNKKKGEEHASRPISCTAVSKYLSVQKASANIPTSVTPHVLRATLATNLHRQSIPVGDIQRALGHKDIGTTMRYVRNTYDVNTSAVLRSNLVSFVRRK